MMMIIYMQITRWHCGTVPKSAERADQPHTLLPHAFFHHDHHDHCYHQHHHDNDHDDDHDHEEEDGDDDHEEDHDDHEKKDINL